MDEDDDDDDNEYAIYHYQHRYGNTHDDFSNVIHDDNTGFADFDNTPTFDAAFADFSTMSNDNTSSMAATFDANFDNTIDTFATFSDSNFADSWDTAAGGTTTNTNMNHQNDHDNDNDDTHQNQNNSNDATESG